MANKMEETVSALAKTLLTTETVYRPSGPRCSGYWLYRDLDQEDYDAILQMRDRGVAWGEIQKMVDETLGIEESVSVRQFTYHSVGNCTCRKIKESTK